MVGLCVAVFVTAGCSDSTSDDSGSGVRGEAPAQQSELRGSAAADRDLQSETLQEDDTDLGRGFVVWESNRSGSWRIWRRDLDGSGLEQMTDHEPGRDHCCGHLSPDGRWRAYLSLPDRNREYEREGAIGELRLLDTGTGAERVLSGSVRTYFEHRAAVWRNVRELIYINSDNRTEVVDIESGEVRGLAQSPGDNEGWLINSTLTHATSGRPSFSIYDRKRGEILERRILGGCQPYFSHDGRWGYWVAGAGGPIRKVDLASGVSSVLIRRNDPRLTSDFGYLYFPMLSGDGRLFSFAASSGGHDHFRANYDVFVVPVDPETFELAGSPVQMTTDPATDRFPDVFSRPLALGYRSGEAPYQVRFAARGQESDWHWSFGGGTAETSGKEVEHTFETPGVYDVAASRQGTELEGRVRVLPARPPRPESVEVGSFGEEILILFDEPIDAAQASASLASGIGVSAMQAEADQRGLVIKLENQIEKRDVLTLEGIRDRAQQPNEMTRVELEILPPLWPSRKLGLAFIWQTADAANLLFDHRVGAERAVTLEPRGRARLNHDFAMVLGDGAFVAGEELSTSVSRLLQDANEFTLEVTLDPHSVGNGAKGTILSFAGARAGRLLEISQGGKHIYLLLKTGKSRVERTDRVKLGSLRGDGPQHLVVTYSPGELVAYFDGRRTLRADVLQDDFFHWRAGRLIVGDVMNGRQAWRGNLEGLAIYARAIDEDEVREDMVRYRSLRNEREVVATTVVRARPLRRSRAPSLAEISPYREALAVTLYEVTEVISGTLDGMTTVRVAEWTILGGEVLPVNGIDREVTLVLEPFAGNPQLESIFLSDEAGAEATGKLMYRVDL